jgi:predicted RND superfamily exporter protein
MANKSKRKQREQQRQADEKIDAEIRQAMSEPWIQQRSGLMMMVLLSVGFAAFMTWQLYPTEGVGRAIMWGLGSAVALWLVFLLAFGFNKLVRR